MYNNYELGPLAGVLGIFGIGFLIMILWSAFWKGLALWHSARRGKYWWFIIFLFVNTLGILEIIYLFAILRLRFSELFTLSEKKGEGSETAKEETPKSEE